MKYLAKRLYNYLNPIAHLGEKQYSTRFPFVTLIAACIFSEYLAYRVFSSPDQVGLIAIFLFIALIIYFSFREGIKGGFIATVITIFYYFYIIITRGYTGEQLTSGVNTTLILGILYFLLTGTVGWLRQTLDSVIEREANERRRLEIILEQLPVGVVVTNKEAQVIQSNKQAEKILGVEIPLDFQIGEKMLADLAKNTKRLNFEGSPILKAISDGAPINGVEYVFDRDEKKTYIQMSAAPIRNIENKIIAAAAIISDTTFQKEMEIRKDDFVNMASHELKTPITSMKLYLDSLKYQISSFGNEKALKTLDSIANQTEKLQKLVNDLLDVSRLQTGKLSFDKNDFYLDELIQETVEILQVSSRKRNLVFENVEKIQVRADRFRIYQVLTNLINNAIKYSEENQDIIVKLTKEDKQAVISVQDFGIGISKDEQEKIFERLYQVTEDTQKTFPGFGMGLYISKEIIERHEGKIWVHSEKGKGSTFYFSLPLNHHE